MAFIEKFLGKRVAIPEDRFYAIKQGFWAKPEDLVIAFGLTEPALVLAGGVNDLDWLAGNNASVAQGQSVLFIITGKILYVDAPVGGLITFNETSKTNPSLISEDPYEKGWLFRIKPNIDMNLAIQAFGDAQQYMSSLQGSEGMKNPEGLKGVFQEFVKPYTPGFGNRKFPRAIKILWIGFADFQITTKLQERISTMNRQGAFVEIVAKKKGCMLCDLALGILEEIAPEFEEGSLRWEVVDIGALEGLQRLDELTKICGRKPVVPSIVINERIAFDNIPDMESLTDAVRKEMAT